MILSLLGGIFEIIIKEIIFGFFEFLFKSIVKFIKYIFGIHDEETSLKLIKKISL